MFCFFPNILTSPFVRRTCGSRTRHLRYRFYSPLSLQSNDSFSGTEQEYHQLLLVANSPLTLCRGRCSCPVVYDLSFWQSYPHKRKSWHGRMSTRWDTEIRLIRPERRQNGIRTGETCPKTRKTAHGGRIGGRNRKNSARRTDLTPADGGGNGSAEFLRPGKINRTAEDSPLVLEYTSLDRRRFALPSLIFFFFINLIRTSN